MKRILSMILACVLLFGCMCALASCSNVSQSYADKINEKAAADEHLTYDEVMKDLGDDAVDLTVKIINHSGVIYAVKGCSTWDDIQAKIDAGETVKGVVITIVSDKATAAVYKEITEKD